MSSLVRRRVIRSAEADEEVFVIGEAVRGSMPAEGPVATISSMLEGAQRRAEDIVADAEQRAAQMVAGAEAEAAAIREAARTAGFEAGVEAGRSGADAEAAAALAMIRNAAAEGLAIRNAMIDEAMPAIARAIAMATRRVVGAAYEADHTLVVEAAAEAVRAAAGQQVLALRVTPGDAEAIRAALIDLTDYVRPDEGIGLGGCIVELRHGTIDATLDARLDLMEIALHSAGGAE